MGQFMKPKRKEWQSSARGGAMGEPERKLRIMGEQGIVNKRADVLGTEDEGRE